MNFVNNLASDPRSKVIVRCSIFLNNYVSFWHHELSCASVLLVQKKLRTFSQFYYNNDKKFPIHFKITFSWRSSKCQGICETNQAMADGREVQEHCMYTDYFYLFKTISPPHAIRKHSLWFSFIKFSRLSL